MSRADWTAAERALSRPSRMEGRQMGWGRRSRWGSCEGYGLEIGNLLRFAIVANADRTIWRVSLNSRELGLYDDLDAAIAAAERKARSEMQTALEHWSKFHTEPKAKRRAGRNRV